MPDTERTWDEILRIMMKVTRGENCSLMFRSPGTDDLVILAAKGRRDLDTRMSDVPFRKRFELDGGVAAWVLENGCGVYVSDVENDARFVQIEESPFKIGSLMCFPVRDGYDTLGILNLSHGEKGAFGQTEEQAMNIASHQVAITMTTATIGRGGHHQSDATNPNTVSATPKTRNTPEEGASQLELPSQNGNGGDEKLLLLYESGKMRKVVETIDQIADTDVTVLIQGESGTGKELVARALHYRSVRKNMPFMKVNCAALPEELLESELFGYEKGAFTGAYRRKPGKFELAHGGTIFLDEIADISPSLQAKLLQVLQDGEFARLGGKRDIHVDARVLVATNKDLPDYVKIGRFRADLFYRLNVVNIHVPPLRERKDELPLLARYLLDRYSRKYEKPVPVLSPETSDLLLLYDWPGNIRELENMIKRLVVLGNEKVIRNELSQVFSPGWEPSEPKREETPRPKSLSLKEISRRAAHEAEGKLIQATLEQTRWNRKKAAKLLGISYKALLYKIKACGLDRTPA
jgi:transcriptional regulator with GAF, ATPase, and Fis domain